MARSDDLWWQGFTSALAAFCVWSLLMLVLGIVGGMVGLVVPTGLAATVVAELSGTTETPDA